VCLCKQLKKKSYSVVQIGIWLILEAMCFEDLHKSYNTTNFSIEKRVGDQVGAPTNFF